MPRTNRHVGIIVRHRPKCPAREDQDAPCRCSPSYTPWVWDARNGRKIRKTFDSLAAAKAWRVDMLVAVRKGDLQPATRVTLSEAAEVWLEGVKQETIRNRSGDTYKPSVVRGYEASLRKFI